MKAGSFVVYSGTLLCAALLQGAVLAQETAGASRRFENTAPAYKKGEGPMICIDKAHRNFHDAEGGYRPFADLLEEDGFRIASFDKELTRENLAACSLLVIVNPGTISTYDEWVAPHKEAFSKTEILEVLLWIRGGRSLLLVVDHAPFPAAVGDLGTALGLNMFDGKAKNGPGKTLPDIFSLSDGTLKPHPILQGRHEGERVKRVATWVGHPFQASREYEPLLVFGEHSEAWPVLEQPFSTEGVPRGEWPVLDIHGWLHGAAREWGRGRIVVLGEASMCTAAVDEENPRGMYAPGAEDNAQFCLNVVHWLEGLLDAGGGT